jgi:TatD DNase family protein
MFNKNELANVLSDRSLVGLASNSTGYESCLENLRLGGKHQKIKACLGIHPEHPKNYKDLEKVVELIIKNESKVAGIGEIGIPCFMENLEDFYDESLEVFRELVKIAHTFNKPVTVHASYEAAGKAVAILEEYNIQKAVFHWFNGDEKDLDRIQKNNYHVSVGPDILYNTEYANFVRKIDVKNIFFESDSPWEYDKVRSMPLVIPEVIVYTSSVKSVSIDRLSFEAMEKSVKFFSMQ